MSSRRFHAACLLIAVASTFRGAGYLRAFPPENAIERQLKTPIDISFENTPLKTVLEELRDLQGINIVPDKPALDEAGVSMESPISIKLKQVSLRSALVLILHQVKLTYVVRDGVLQFTTPQRAQAQSKQKRLTYPVADLLHGPMTQAELIDLTTRSIAPESWSISGGKGRIEYVKETKALMISQSIDVHEQIQDLLAALRRLEDAPLTPPAGR